MAVLKFSDKKTANVSAATGLRIWQILNGQAEPDDEREEAICNKVDKIYLNWRDAPDDYIKERFDYVARAVMSSWMIASEPSAEKGKHQVSVKVPTRPQPGDKFNREFSKKWGLLKNGAPTTLARRYM